MICETSFCFLRRFAVAALLVILASPGARAGDNVVLSREINRFFQDSFDRDVARHPVYQSYLGIKDDYDKWDDESERGAKADIAVVRADLKELRARFAKALLNPAYRLSYRLFESAAQRKIDGFKYRFHNYPVNQMFGEQAEVPAFLINIHAITSVADARAYIARLKAMKTLFGQIIAKLRESEARGIIAPKFAFTHALVDARNIITGAPFNAAGGDSPLLADFKAKVAALDIDDKQRNALITAARRAMLQSVAPSYRVLIAVMKDLEAKSPGNNGVWALPDGEAYYAWRLRSITTTDLSADEIHAIGLREVARIHGEMRQIMAKVGFAGSLQDFFAFMKTDERFYYPQTAKGKAAYLARAKEIIAAMKARLDSEFRTKPKADLIVKAVEPFREKSAGRAFYQRPSKDGRRPGIYYVNTYNMKATPKYEMEALAFHEGIPGHHMQLAIAQELTGIPDFRKYGGYTAYIEGWGLYAEYLGKEMGFYRDPYDDFGRLSMELWRAARLVVDTGLHHNRWSYERAVDYLTENTPTARPDAIKAVERYLVMPSQATAYKIGMMEIQRLRAEAQRTLGDRFDVRDYHDVVLGSGAVPLDVLRELVRRWVSQQKG